MSKWHGLVAAMVALAGCAPAPATASFTLGATQRRITIVGHLSPVLGLQTLVKAYALSDIQRLVVTVTADSQTVATQTVNSSAFTATSTIALGNLAPEKVYTVKLDAYSDAGVTLISDAANSTTTVDTRADVNGAVSDVLNTNFNLKFQAKAIALAATLPINATQTFDSVTVALAVGSTAIQSKNVVGPWFGHFTVTLNDLRPNTSYVATVTGKKSGSPDVVQTSSFSTPPLDGAGTSDAQTLTAVSL